ncbi:hypothetical protein [Synechococcus sp. MIT S9504]|nr:hypothetical protein [Synechococcus sp. MIT S9504]
MISVAADWLICIDAGSFGLLDILTIIDLLNYATAGFVELTQE